MDIEALLQIEVTDDTVETDDVESLRFSIFVGLTNLDVLPRFKDRVLFDAAFTVNASLVFFILSSSKSEIKSDSELPSEETSSSSSHT